MLTVNSCNTYDHYDRLGNLSPRGKEDFWYEIDNLLERFIRNKVKLLPAPTYHNNKRSANTASTSAVNMMGGRKSSGYVNHQRKYDSYYTSKFY